MTSVRSFSRATRTLMQLVAGGGLAALVAAVSEAVRDSPIAVALLALAATWVVSYAQNWLEDHGQIVDRRAD